MDQASSRSAIYDFGRDQFRAAVLAVLGAGVTPALRYGGLSEEEPADGTYWARVTSQVVDEAQETLRNGQEQRRFRTVGIVTVQLFAPRSVSRSLDQLDHIAERIKNAFRTYRNDDLEFTNARIADNVRAEANWQRANVVSNYTYRQFIS